MVGLVSLGPPYFSAHPAAQSMGVKLFLATQSVSVAARADLQ